MFQRLVAISIFTIIPVSMAWAQCSYVVAPSGNDSNPGTLAAPMLTPQHAIQSAAPGATVCLRSGNYAVTSNIVIDRALTFQAYPQEAVVLTADHSSSSPVGNVIFVAASNVTVQNLEISGGSYYGIQVNSYYLGAPPQDTHISHVKVHDTGYSGIKTYQADGVVIDNSEVYNNDLTMSGGVGIDIMASLPSAGSPLHGAVIRTSHIHDTNVNGMYMKAGTVGGLMENNFVERVGSSGILAGGDSGAAFMRNGATSECINCVVRNNVVVGTEYAGIGCWGAQQARILNNTVIGAAHTGQAAFFAVPDGLGYACTGATVENNIFQISSGNRVVHVVNPGPGMVLDYNLYYSTTASYPMWWESSSLSGYWSGLAGWQAGTGQDAHSVAYEAPLLDTNNLYREVAGSPSIDRGATLADVPTDYAGTNRPQGSAYDIGAFEFPAGAAPVPSMLSIVQGSNQSATNGALFGTALAVKVTDSSGNGVAGIPVVFTAPASSASGTFGGSAIASVVTAANGIATAPAFTANSVAGPYNVMTSSYNLNTVSFSLTNTAPVTAPHVTVTFLKTDTTTKGNWRVAYGAQGYNVIGDLASNPSYAAPSPSGQAYFTWASSSTDIRALQKPSNPSDRIAANWFTTGSFTIDLNTTDQLTHQVALYCLDWDNKARVQTVDVLDVSGKVLNTRSVSGFSGGVYLVWNISGHVILRITNAGVNGVVSGVFFGGAPPATANFVKSDIGTQGNWKGIYGGRGYNIEGNSAANPSYAAPALTSASTYTWAGSTTDVRALQKPSNPSDRISGTWYSGSTFSIALNPTDILPHQVTLYCLDWDSNARSETISVLDAAGHVLNSQTLSGDFNGGVYLVWNVSGAVKFRVTNNNGINAVVSGIFFD